MYISQMKESGIIFVVNFGRPVLTCCTVLLIIVEELNSSSMVQSKTSVLSLPQEQADEAPPTTLSAQAQSYSHTPFTSVMLGSMSVSPWASANMNTSSTLGPVHVHQVCYIGGSVYSNYNLYFFIFFSFLLSRILIFSFHCHIISLSSCMFMFICSRSMMSIRD